MTEHQRCLGIVDWGIGGLGLLGRLDADLPELPVVYWSDTGAIPYGLQPSAALTARLRAIVAALAERGCTEVVLACNAASTVVGRLQSEAIPVAGIIAAGIASVPSELDGTIGVVGGRRTIWAGSYRRSLSRPGRRVISRVAQPLSAHIEAGRAGSAEFSEDLAAIVRPLVGADAVVLACTHYPAAADQFAAALPGTLLLDPAASMAADLVARLGPSARAGGTGARTIVTTGAVDLMRSSATRAWGIDLPVIDRAS